MLNDIEKEIVKRFITKNLNECVCRNKETFTFSNRYIFMMYDSKNASPFVSVTCDMCGLNFFYCPFKMGIKRIEGFGVTG